MAARDKGTGAVSYASTDSALRKAMPEALRNAASLRESFEPARDPLIAKQWADLKKSEKQRRDKGDGSGMIKKSKSVPELKPKNANVVKRSSFNQAWFKEQREAIYRQFERERINAAESPVRSRTRSFGMKR